MKKEILKRLIGQTDYLSGEGLSTEFGVSRAAINKQVMALRKLGYEIESVTNRGYRLLSKPMMNQLELELLVDKLPLTAKFHDTIDSTNQAAKQCNEETIIVALEQTKGRGRRGRDWVSQKGQGLYFSLSLKPDISPSHISSITQLAGLCVARALGSDAQIKWPNDVFIHGKKVSGILTELITQADYVEKLIIGIGVNFTPVEDMPTAISLEEAGIKISMTEFLEGFLTNFYAIYPRFLEKTNLSEWLGEINQRSYLQGKNVYALGSDIHGVFIGIDEDGQALVQGDELHVLSYGEISLRGSDDPT